MPQLTWLGDEAARRASRRVPYRILVPVETVGDPTADNLLIQGDNLETLKALLPIYAGQVKCIYIDPPYNTKSAFEHYDDNLEHSQWLSMMYPRLELLRELLSEDGSLWMSIDDAEGHYLKVLSDEIFSRRGFVATVAWQQRTTRENRKVFSSNYEYILAYARNPSEFARVRNDEDLSEDVKNRYKNPDNDPRGPWQSVSANAQAGHATPSQFYVLIAPNGKKHSLPHDRCWLYTQERMNEQIAKGNIWFGRDGNGVPRIKMFLADAKRGLTPETLWLAKDSGTNDLAKKHIVELFPGPNVFATPKPEQLVRRLLRIATNPGDLVLDSFLGSGTTAAVAHKMGRRWIGIEMGEHARTHCVPRLKKVVEGEQGGISEAVGWKGGGGFRFMKLGAKAFLDDGALNPDIRFKDLAAYLWFLETRFPLETSQVKGPVLGVNNGAAYVLLYNGVLGDRRPDGGNVLTTAVWNEIRRLLPRDRREAVIYGEACRFSSARLRDLGITFKQIPYDISMR